MLIVIILIILSNLILCQLPFTMRYVTKYFKVKIIKKDRLMLMRHKAFWQLQT
jgi:hypothetical protein